jgi:hypothetical protein
MRRIARDIDPIKDPRALQSVRMLASTAEHATEFGTTSADSPPLLGFGRPSVVLDYDLHRAADMGRL